jgi:hypothetical protein
MGAERPTYTVCGIDAVGSAGRQSPPWKVKRSHLLSGMSEGSTPGRP